MYGWLVMVVGMALLVSVQSATAQVTIGAVVGVNNTGISGDKPPGTSFGSRPGPIVGLVLEIPVAKGVALVFQPDYLQSGAKIGFNVDGQEEPVDSLDFQLDYVSLPILIKVITDGGRWYVTSGIEFGFLSSATLSTVNGSTETDVKDLLNDTNLSVIFGVGRMFPVGRPKITAEIRYNQSLLNLASSTGGSSDLPVRFRASGFQLMAGVLLPLGGQR